MKLSKRIQGIALIGVLGPMLGGCSYDYLQHTDRVSYVAGNAVKANLERETIDPAKKSKGKTTGLGKSGSLVPTEDAATP